MIIAIVNSFTIFCSLLLAIHLFAPVKILGIYVLVRPLLQPFALMQYKMGGLPIALIVTAIMLLAGMVCLALKDDWKFFAPKGLSYSLLVALAGFSIIYSVDQRNSLEGLAKLLCGWFILNMTFNGVRSEKDARFILKSLAYSSILPMMVGFYQALTGRYNLFYQSGVDRVNSVFGIGNAYGIYLSIIIAALIVLLIQETVKKKKLFFITLLTGAIVSQVLALNRGTWVALSCGFLTAILLFRRKIHFRWVVLTVVAVAILFSGTIVQRFSEIEVVTHGRVRNTFQGRIDYWKAIIPIMLKRPLTGYGVGTSDAVTSKFLGKENAPHNDYLRIALEIGILGTLLYLAFLSGIFFFFFLQRAKENGWEYNFALFMLSVYFIIISTTQNILFNLINFPAFLMMVGIGVKVSVTNGFGNSHERT